VTEFGSFDNSTCKRVLDHFEPGDLTLGYKLQTVIASGTLLCCGDQVIIWDIVVVMSSAASLCFIQRLLVTWLCELDRVPRDGSG